MARLHARHFTTTVVYENRDLAPLVTCVICRRARLVPLDRGLQQGVEPVGVCVVLAAAAATWGNGGSH